MKRLMTLLSAKTKRWKADGWLMKVNTITYYGMSWPQSTSSVIEHTILGLSPLCHICWINSQRFSCFALMICHPVTEITSEKKPADCWYLLIPIKTKFPISYINAPPPTSNTLECSFLRCLLRYKVHHQLKIFPRMQIIRWLCFHKTVWSYRSCR